MSPPDRLKNMALIVAFLIASTAASGAQEQTLLVITGGTLIDGNGGAPVENAIVVVEGNRISAIGEIDEMGEIDIPASVETLDATGKWVLPGLWDNYGNYSWYLGDAMLRQGITSFVDIGNGEEVSIVHRDAVNAGKIRGPRTWAAVGHFGDVVPEDITGFETALSTRQLPRTVEEARRRTNVLLDGGSDAIQFHETRAFSNEIIIAACEEAHARNVPCSVRANGPNMYATEAALAGVDMIGRARGVEFEITRDGVDVGNNALDRFTHMDEAKARRVIDILVSEDTYLIPNIVHFFPGYQRDWARMNEAVDEMFSDPDLLAYYPASAIAEMREGRSDVDAGALREARMVGYQNLLRFYRMFDEAGGKALVGGGTNAGKPPGLILNDEMEAFQEAGIPAMHILQSATKWNAEAMRKIADYGTLEPGKIADIVIVDADPLADIANMRTISDVVFDGKRIDRSFTPSYDTPFRGAGGDIRVVENLGSTVELKEIAFAPSGGGLPNPERSPQPAIQAIDPIWSLQGDPELKLTLTGFNFVRRSRITFDDIAVPWRWLSPTEIELSISENLLARAGRFDIVITNPAPLENTEHGNGISNKAHFIVNFRLQ